MITKFEKVSDRTFFSAYWQCIDTSGKQFYKKTFLDVACQRFPKQVEFSDILKNYKNIEKILEAKVIDNLFYICMPSVRQIRE